jgi:hypothetical protein
MLKSKRRSVRVNLDEEGNVLSAKPVSGRLCSRSCLKIAKLREKCGNTHEVSVSSDFGFWILDFGLVVRQNSNPQSEIRNPKSYGALTACGLAANFVDFLVFKQLLRSCLKIHLGHNRRSIKRIIAI